MLFNNEPWKKHQNSFGEHDQIDIAVDVLNPSVSFSKTKAFETAWEAYVSSPKAPQVFEGLRSWRQQGGRGRRHEILVELYLSKIKLTHEVYRTTTEQSSRQGRHG